MIETVKSLLSLRSSFPSHAGSAKHSACCWAATYESSHAAAVMPESFCRRLPVAGMRL